MFPRDVTPTFSYDDDELALAFQLFGAQRNVYHLIMSNMIAWGAQINSRVVGAG